MANPYFSFKQFTVYHDQCAMKVGIDGVLLGVWTRVNDTNHILDIGTGSGLIALMLAQRSNSLIDAIDIEPNAVKQSLENVKHSPWSNRVNVMEMSLQNFANTTTHHYDLIVSNPPFFVNSLKTPIENRTTARHTDCLSHEELIFNAKRLLNPTGRISIILPIQEALVCKNYALNNGLFCTREVRVIPKPNALARRMLMEFMLYPNQKELSEIIIEANERHHYSEEFSLLAKDFYLKL